MKRLLGFLILTPVGWVIMLAAAVLASLWLLFKLIRGLYARD